MRQPPPKGRAIRALAAFNKDFDGTPIAFILLGILIMVQLGAWHMSNDLDRICQLLADRDIEVSSPQSTKDAIFHICVARRSEE